MRKTDDKFLSDLNVGRQHEAAVVALLMMCDGITVNVPARHTRDDKNNAARFADRYDFTANGRIIDVKSHAFEFPEYPEDWPYPEVLVCAERQHPTAYDFVLVSQVNRGAFYMPGTAPMRLRSYTHPHIKDERSAFFAPKQELRPFTDLVGELQNAAR